MSLPALLLLPVGLLQQPPITVNRYLKFEIPLETTQPGGIDWGDQTRAADHAVVKFNRFKDFAVVYQTTRPDLITPTAPNLRQVELALFQYNGNDSWTYMGNQLLGDVHIDALGRNVPLMKCERPDVVGIGDCFFTHWTRRYENLPFDPSVEEGSWTQWDPGTSTFRTYTNYPLTPGRGFDLDFDGNLNNGGANLWVEECAGVPDAVILDDSTPVLKVGVVYLHQTQFSGSPNGNRSFQIRFLTTSFDSGNPALPFTKTNPEVLFASVNFNGPDNDAAGLILPEVSEASVSSRFLLAFEEQLQVPPPGTGFYGRIRLHLMDNSTGSWDSLQSHTFGSSSSPASRRRALIDSLREASLAAGKDLVTIAFNKIVPNTNNADVVFEEWAFDPNVGVYKVLWPAGTGWDNDPGGVAWYDFRPSPIHGFTSTFRRCITARFLNPAPPPPPYWPPPPLSPRDMLEYRMATDDYQTLDTGDLGRAATDYLHDPTHPTQPDYLVVTWEKATPGQSDSRIQVIVR